MQVTLSNIITDNPGLARYAENAVIAGKLLISDREIYAVKIKMSRFYEHIERWQDVEDNEALIEVADCVRRYVINKGAGPYDVNDITPRLMDGLHALDFEKLKAAVG